MSQESGDSRRTGERAQEKTADDRGNGTRTSSQKLDNVPNIHYYLPDTMTELCCRAYVNIFVTQERDSDREKLRILTEENAQLQYEKKSSLNESTNLEKELDSARLRIMGKKRKQCHVNRLKERVINCKVNIFICLKRLDQNFTYFYR